uniref:Elongation factor 1-alpha n=1 Tax=Dicyema japonicum TaxID=399803 RepID=B9ZYW2_DICJA|nr:elongation factor 1-alpha [Dicyema japonicum]
MGEPVEETKETLGLVIIGHIDAGKSTLCGRLLVENGGIDKRTMSKLEKEAGDMGRSSFKYAFAMDLTKAERSRGITITSTVKCFETQSYKVTIVDAPGHKDFVKNMITGTCNADAAILVIDSTPGGFEAGISSGGQTRQHAQLAFASGVSTLIVAINKLDSVNEGEQQERYDVIMKEIGNILKNIGFFKTLNMVPYVPISAFCGRNISEASTCFDWMPNWKYRISRKGEDDIWKEGVTLLDAIDSVVKPPSPAGFDLRICVTDAFKHPTAGVIASMAMRYGIAIVGMQLFMVPAAILTILRSLELHNKAFNSLCSPNTAGMALKGVNLGDLKRGSMLGPIHNPPMFVKSFTARVVVMQHPTKIKDGYSPVVDYGTSHTACKFRIIKVLKESKLHQKMALDPEEVFLAPGDVAMVEFEPMAPLFIETSSDFPRLARFSVRDSGIVVAIGNCETRLVHEMDASSKKALEKALNKGDKAATSKAKKAVE